MALVYPIESRLYLWDAGNADGAYPHERGGGMYNYQSSNPTLTGVTFSGNYAYEGGGMYNLVSNLTLTNTILWGNTASDGAQILNDTSVTGSNPVISHSDIQGSNGSGASWDTALGTDGGGNIDADPQFVRSPSPGGDGTWGTGDDDYGNLRLRLTSPAIDAGDNAALPPGVTTALDGKPRFADVASVPDTGNGYPPIVGMGAYEAMNELYLPLVKR